MYYTYLKNFSALLILSLLSIGLYSQQIQLLNSDNLRIDGINKMKYCTGNIRILNDGVYIHCDSAAINDAQNTMEGHGNVYIFQPDTFNLRGKMVFFNANTKMARVSGDVFLSDNQMVLNTPFIDYNTLNKSGSYSAGGTIISGSDVLSSEKGYYDSRNKVASFRKNVLLKNPDYTVISDTLQYFTSKKTAYFFGPTTLLSDNNKIECVYGWYNTSLKQSSFSKRAHLYSQTSIVSADSFFYDRGKGIGLAYVDIVLYDTLENFKVYGQNGWYNENSKVAKISEWPMAEKFSEKDTFFVLADTFYYFSDTANRRLEALKNAKILSAEMSGKSDSLYYFTKDSCIVMKNTPYLWNGKSQINGDSIHIQMRENKIHTMHVVENSFVISWHEEDRFDQIAGNRITNFFDNNKLQLVDVEGKAQSIYYSRDNDTGAYSAINKIESGKMAIYLDSNKVSQIKIFPSPNPSGKLYPPKQFSTEDKKLKGFTWLPHLQPLAIDFIERRPVAKNNTENGKN